VVLAAAQDTGGLKAAKTWYDRAGVTFPALIDPDHTLTALYGMVNVPTGVWIDEAGTIVRPPETAYSKSFTFMGQKLGDPRYVPALRDWVEHGAASRYVMRGQALGAKLAKSDGKRLAAVQFRLGTYFHRKGDAAQAKKHWSKAHGLDPDNWNFQRQAWSFEGLPGQMKWLQKVRGLGDKPYYEPLELPDAKPLSKGKPLPPTKRRWF
jgi:hypothetical protein